MVTSELCGPVAARALRPRARLRGRRPLLHGLKPAPSPVMPSLGRDLIQLLESAACRGPAPCGRLPLEVTLVSVMGVLGLETRVVQPTRSAYPHPQVSDFVEFWPRPS